MKKLNLFSAMVGLIFGLVLAGALPSVQRLLAQETNKVASEVKKEEAKKEGMSEEEMGKKLDEILDSQKKLQEKISGILEQSKFLKVSIK